MIKKIISVLAITIFICSCDIKFNDKNIKLDNKNQKNITQQYVSGSDGIPLFEGLEQLNDDSANFDSMSGNIFISDYKGKLELNQVKVFYLQTLPQLGWELVSNKNNNLLYVRNNDKLKVSLKNKNGELIVKFFISSSL